MGRAEAGGVFPILVGERLPQAVQDIAISGLEHLLPAQTKCSSSRQIPNLPGAYQGADCSVGSKCDTERVKQSCAATVDSECDLHGGSGFMSDADGLRHTTIPLNNG